MGGVIPGYPTPALDPDHIQPDPEDDNPNELVLDPDELGEPLPPLDELRRTDEDDTPPP